MKVREGFNPPTMTPVISPLVSYHGWLVAWLTRAGNALTVAVLRLDPDKTNSTTWLLQTLAAVDTVYLASSVVIQPLTVVHERHGVLARWFPLIQRYVRPLDASQRTRPSPSPSGTLNLSLIHI